MGPSTIQPVVAAGWLGEGVRAAVRAALPGLAGEGWMSAAMIARFEAVDDAGYDDLRRMRDEGARAGLR